MVLKSLAIGIISWPLATLAFGDASGDLDNAANQSTAATQAGSDEGARGLAGNAFNGGNSSSGNGGNAGNQNAGAGLQNGQAIQNPGVSTIQNRNVITRPAPVARSVAPVVPSDNDMARNAMMGMFMGLLTADNSPAPQPDPQALERAREKAREQAREEEQKRLLALQQAKKPVLDLLKGGETKIGSLLEKPKETDADVDADAEEGETATWDKMENRWSKKIAKPCK